MAGHVITNKPGSVRTVLYHRRDENGKYPVVYWGTIEEQVKEAQAKNREFMFSGTHEEMKLYTMAEDCPHSNPDEDEKFDGVDDLIDAWMERNCPGLQESRDYTLKWKNRERAIAVIPLAAEHERASHEYHDTHNTVCLEGYMGTCCLACTEGGDDWGYEPEPCRLGDKLRDQNEEFYDAISELKS